MSNELIITLLAVNFIASLTNLVLLIKQMREKKESEKNENSTED